MEYTNILVPILLIASCLIIGFILGTIVALYSVVEEHEDLTKECDKFRALYFSEVKKWKDKYVDTHPDMD
tara:strand:+ start:2630 stop:2839 length:210 start_codon:yes stop_codon:yes gene_type:complete